MGGSRWLSLRGSAARGQGRQRVFRPGHAAAWQRWVALLSTERTQHLGASSPG